MKTLRLADVYDNTVLLLGRYKDKRTGTENRRFLAPSQLLRALILIFKANNNFQTFTVSYAKAFKNQMVKLQLKWIEEVIIALFSEGWLEFSKALDTFLYDPFKDCTGFYVSGPNGAFRFIMNAVVSDLKEYINISRRMLDRKVIVISSTYTGVRYKDNRRLLILDEIFNEFGLRKIPLDIKKRYLKPLL